MWSLWLQLWWPSDTFKMVWLVKHIKLYFAETSLHGLKYITEDDRHIVERTLWVILFFIGLSLMITFMIPG